MILIDKPSPRIIRRLKAQQLAPFLQNGSVDASSSVTPVPPPQDTKEDTDGGGSSDGEPPEFDYNNLSFLEIPAISSADEDDDSSGDEVPYHKPSRVCFSKNPIKVFATFSTGDYDRRNEDVDPVAASAEYELEKRVEKMDVFPVDLQKGAEGLGLSIIGMGVGADAGLEKLGIFVKTLTPNGAAQRSQQIQVNDQIIEVDGKSLVGVTQSYAASVLRNTSGHVKFLIGREKDPSKSEVARLIQQSLAQDRRREEMREREQQRLKDLEDSFQPKDEVLERHAHEHQQQHQEPMEDEGDDTENSSDIGDEEKGIEDALEKESNGAPSGVSPDFHMEESGAGDTTPQSPPQSNGDHSSSQDDLSEVAKQTKRRPADLDEDDISSGSLSPDSSDKLQAKIKEGQGKLAAAEAEVTKLKAKVIVLEETEAQKKSLEKKVDDLTRKFLERDQHFETLNRELAQYKDMMVASQSQHIELEKKVRELQALEKKYHKAKKLIKDYQQREKDFIQERESFMEQQNEKDQQYNALVKSLKDRIFNLEKELKQVQQEAGLPETPTSTSSTKIAEAEEAAIRVSSSYQSKPLVKATLNGSSEEPLSPLNQSTEDVLETSTCSEVSEPGVTPADSERTASVEFLPLVERETKASSPVSPRSNQSSKSDLDSVLTSSPLLDSTASRDKAQLAASGSIANRRPPTKKGFAADLFGDDVDSGSTKSEVTENGSIHSSSHAEDTPEKARRHQPQSLPTHQGEDEEEEVEESSLDMWNKHDRQDDTCSDTSSSVSQTSYDPNKAEISWGGKSELPDSVPEDSEDGGVTLVSAKASPAAKGFSFPKFSWKPSLPSLSGGGGKGGGGGDSGGVVLLSSRGLGGSKHQSGSDPGGIMLLSSRRLDTGLPDTDASSTNSDMGPSMMVSEPEFEDNAGRSFTLNISGTPAAEDNPSPNKRSQNQVQSRPIAEWQAEHVAHWLLGLEMEQYSATFRDKGITGTQLLQLDGSKLKALGISNSKDRELLKKKIKDLRTTVERDRKLQEKERKLREKEQKKIAKKK